MDSASRYLLLTEHVGDPPKCLFCSATPDRLHDIGCLTDLALSERGLHTAGDRDAARERMKYASNTTLPAPPSSGSPLPLSGTPTSPGERDLDELEPAPLAPPERKL